MHQGSSLKGNVATVTSVGSILHLASVLGPERGKYFPSADLKKITVNVTSACDAAGSILDAYLSLSTGVQNSTTSLSVFGG